jgi:D-amino peptidase
MRVLISVDMEGIAGVSGPDDILHGRYNYDRFRRLMTEEANLAVAGAFQAGADSVVVNDSHDGMRNVMYEHLDERAELISGFNKQLCMVEGVDQADAAVFIGYHAWAGTAQATMDHTISGGQIHNWWLNGELVGESQINAAIAGQFGVPVVFVSGDDKLAQQIQATLPGTRTAVVKYALDGSVVRSRPLSEVRRLIREGVAEAVAARQAIPVKKVDGPAIFRMEFKRSTHAEVACLLPMVERIGPRTVEVSGRDVVEAWRLAFGAMRLGSTCDAG